MSLPTDRIVKFIKQHHLLSLSFSEKNNPWSCSCFYKYIEKDVSFLITSDEHTKHIQISDSNPRVSGTIALETKIIGKIRGIQFTGLIRKVPEDQYRYYKKMYLLKFPFAILKSTPLWIVDISSIKMTDNRLGFGKKIYWEKQ